MIGEASTNMLQKAEELRERDMQMSNMTGWSASRKKRALKNEYNKWKRDVYLIEKEFDMLEIARYHQGENPVISCTKLLFGIIFAVLSICWVVHILIYIVMRPLTPSGYPTSIFLNDIFIACENAGLYVLSVAFFAAFNLYLLVCTVKGCLKFGMRIFFFFAIHPMRPKETPLNSILFNVILVLLTCGAVVQFSQECFADYVRLTDADLIFSVQIKYLMFYRFFFENDIFIYTLLGWFLLTLIYLLVRPREVKVVKFDKKIDKKMKKLGGLT
jgi:LMBR1 domain-containing protein 1